MISYCCNTGIVVLHIDVTFSSVSLIQYRLTGDTPTKSIISVIVVVDFVTIPLPIVFASPLVRELVHEDRVHIPNVAYAFLLLIAELRAARLPADMYVLLYGMPVRPGSGRKWSDWHTTYSKF